MATKAWRARNRKAQLAGFKNYYHYRKTIERNPKARKAAETGGRRGRTRYLAAGLQQGLIRIPGRKGSKKRGAYLRELIEDVLDDGGDPWAFMESIGSPRRGKA